MKNKKTASIPYLILNHSEIPIDGNLGLLAYGDIAFTAWRKLKKESKNKGNNEKE